MKIRFIKDVTLDVETQAGEAYDKSFRRWSEIRVENIFRAGKQATIKTDDNLFLLMVPLDAFEELPEKKPEIFI